MRVKPWPPAFTHTQITQITHTHTHTHTHSHVRWLVVMLVQTATPMKRRGRRWSHERCTTAAAAAAAAIAMRPACLPTCLLRSHSLVRLLVQDAVNQTRRRARHRTACHRAAIGRVHRAYPTEPALVRAPSLPGGVSPPVSSSTPLVQAAATGCLLPADPTIASFSPARRPWRLVRCGFRRGGCPLAKPIA